MKHTDGMPDVSEWDLDAVNELEKSISSGIRKAASEAIHRAMQDDGTYLYFNAPYMANQDDSDEVASEEYSDPLDVCLRVAIGSDEGCYPVYRFNLRDAFLIDTDIFKEDVNTSLGLRKLSSALHKLADEIHSIDSSKPFA